MSTPAQFFGEADFEFQGESFRLTVSAETILHAEGILDEAFDVWGAKLHAAIASGRKPQMRHVAALVYAAVVCNHPEFKQRTIVEIAMGMHGPDAKASLEAALESAGDAIELPKLPEGEVGNGSTGNRQQRRATKAGTGMKSSASGAKPASRRKSSGSKRRAG
ncbi:MAG: hypothetical protein GW859_04760 [Sphingomonadales bacterium]|nr:hypothetical protein [Sphingomonadales bacterium]